MADCQVVLSFQATGFSPLFSFFILDLKEVAQVVQRVSRPHSDSPYWPYSLKSFHFLKAKLPGWLAGC